MSSRHFGAFSCCRLPSKNIITSDEALWFLVHRPKCVSWFQLPESQLTSLNSPEIQMGLVVSSLMAVSLCWINNHPVTGSQAGWGMRTSHPYIMTFFRVTNYQMRVWKQCANGKEVTHRDKPTENDHLQSFIMSAQHIVGLYIPPPTQHKTPAIVSELLASLLHCPYRLLEVLLCWTASVSFQKTFSEGQNEHRLQPKGFRPYP